MPERDANVELVRRWFRGFERGELGLDLCHPEIEIRNWAEVPITGPYHGHDGVRRWWDDIGDAFDYLQWELVELTDAGDGRVVTVQRFGAASGSPAPTSTRLGAVISIRDGKIAFAGRLRLTGPREAGGGAGELQRSSIGEEDGGVWP